MAVWWNLVKVSGLNFPYFPGIFFQCSSQSAMRERSKYLESLYVTVIYKLSLRRSPFVGVLTLKIFHTLQVNRIKSSN